MPGVELFANVRTVIVELVEVIDSAERQVNEDTLRAVTSLTTSTTDKEVAFWLVCRLLSACQDAELIAQIKSRLCGLHRPRRLSKPNDDAS